MNRITPKPLSIAARVVALLFLLTAGVALAVSGDAWAKKVPGGAPIIDPAATATISACGTYNGNNTIYTVVTFTATAAQLATNGDCVTFSGDRSVVFFPSAAGKVAAIIGPGAMSTSSAGHPSVGLHITGDHDLIEGNDAFISGFATGALDSGDSTIGDLLDFGVCTGGFCATGTTTATAADGNGLHITSNNARWANVSAFSNMGIGFWLDGTDHSFISFPFAQDNGGDGILVTGGDTPGVDVFISMGNGGAGVHLGCPSTSGPAPAGCAKNNTGKVADGFVSGNEVGVLLDFSESNAQDIVSHVFAQPANTLDMEDVTAGCGSGPSNFNLWFRNVFSTASVNGGPNPGNAGCIQ